MLVSSSTRGIIELCPRSLVKRAKVDHASLRHITARVEVVGRRLEFASSAQLADPQSLCNQTNLKARHTISAKCWLRTMSDGAYSSFLDQANQDTGASKPSTKSKSAATKAVDTDVPATLQELDQYYTSESDEPFEPVSLKWSGENMPSEST